MKDDVNMTVTVNGGAPQLGSLHVEWEKIDVTSERVTRPDLSWEFMDSNGHFHAWSEDDSLPTLRRELERVPCPDHGDECDGLDIVHHLCVLCGEEVRPQRHPDLDRRFERGQQTWEVEVDAFLPAWTLVSVRVQRGDRLWFGVGRVSRVHGFGPIYRSFIVGEGPLGERPCNPGLATLEGM